MNTIVDDDESGWGAAEMPREIEVDADDLDPKVLQAIRLQAEAIINRMPVPHNYGRIANGEKRLLYWILGIFGSIFVLLLGMSVKGMWDVSGSLNALDQQVTDYHAQDAQNSERNHEDIQRIDDLLERRHGTN